MLIHKITPDNIQQYQHKLQSVLNRPNLLGVFSEGCGHCHAMKPQWEEMKSRLSSQKCGSGVVELDSRVLQHVNNDNIKHKINGFPTIMIIKQGRPVAEYSGDRSTGDLINFFNTHLKDSTTTKKSQNTSTRTKRPRTRGARTRGARTKRDRKKKS